MAELVPPLCRAGVAEVRAGREAVAGSLAHIRDAVHARRGEGDGQSCLGKNALGSLPSRAGSYAQTVRAGTEMIQLESEAEMTATEEATPQYMEANGKVQCAGKSADCVSDSSRRTGRD